MFINGQMKILQIHNYYKTPGGECSVVRAEKKLLELHGHEVRLFSRDSREIDGYSTTGKISALLRIPYNLNIKQELSALLSELRPDVAHVHNVFPLLSPSIYDALSAGNIPTVQTVHNFRFLCPNGLMFIHGKICEQCQTKNLFSSVKNRCIHDSIPVSALYAMALWNAQRTGNLPGNIDRFIALNHFVSDKLKRAGIAPNKISVLGNYIEHYSNSPIAKKRYIVYLGRLSSEKGILTLLSAMDRVRNVTLKVAGTGPLESALKNFAERHALENVEFLGFVDGSDKLKLISEALCTVVPSEWYENFPISVLESLAVGTPVIASRMGGLPEMIEHGVTGLIFTPSDVEELAGSISNLVGVRSESDKMDWEAINAAHSRFGPDAHVKGLTDIYREIVATKSIGS